MLIVAGLSLGLTIYETGAARWLAWLLMGYLSSIHFALRPFVIVVMVAILHLMFSSNTVTGTIIIPILIALAHDLNLDPWVVIGPARLFLIAGVHSCHRGADNRNTLCLGILLHPRHGQGWYLDDACGRSMCERLGSDGGCANGVVRMRMPSGRGSDRREAWRRY